MDSYVFHKVSFIYRFGSASANIVSFIYIYLFGSVSANISAVLNCKRTSSIHSS